MFSNIKYLRIGGNKNQEKVLLLSYIYDDQKIIQQ